MIILRAILILLFFTMPILGIACLWVDEAYFCFRILASVGIVFLFLLILYGANL